MGSYNFCGGVLWEGLKINGFCGGFIGARRKYRNPMAQNDKSYQQAVDTNAHQMINRPGYGNKRKKWQPAFCSVDK